MAFQNVRAMLETFDCPHAAEWRRLPLNRVLSEANVPDSRRLLLSRAFSAFATLAIEHLLAARPTALGTFGAHALEQLEDTLEDHFDAYLDRAHGKAKPAPDAALLRRLADHELTERLDDPIEALGNTRVTQAIRREYRHCTIGELLTIKSRGRGLAPEIQTRARGAARAYLNRTILNVEREAAAAATYAAIDARPLAGSLAVLDGQLAAVVVRHPLLRPRGSFTPGVARFVEPAMIVYSEKQDDREYDLIAIDLSGTSPNMIPRQVRKADAEAVVPAAIVAARRLLRSPREETHGALVRFAEVPRWTRALSAIDLALAQKPRGTLYSFCIKRVKSGATQIWPGELTTTKSGALSFAPRSLHYGQRASNVEDARVLRTLSRVEYSSQRSIEDTLAALVDHPRVYFNSAATPVRVLRCKPVLRARADGGALRIELALGPTTIDATTLVDDSCAVAIDEPARIVRFAVLNDSERALLEALTTHGNVLPREAAETLLPRLERFAESTELELLGDLAGREIPPDSRLIARLDASAWPNVPLALRVRPIPGAEPRVAGEGAPQVRGLVEGESVHTLRDLASERSRTLELATALGVDPQAPEITLTPVDRALETLALLRKRDDVTIEWLSAPVEVTRFLRREELRVSIKRQRDWFTVGADVDVDGRALGLAMLLEAARTNRRYVEVSPGKLVELEDELRARLAALDDHVHTARDGSLEIALTAAPAIAALDAAPVAPPAFVRVLERLGEATASEPSLPGHLTKIVRPYQREGFAWLARLGSWGAGGVLADDMGLGKTLQAIALLCTRAADGPTLVVAPTSVVGNWLAELARFGKGLRALDYRTAGRADVLAKLGPKDVLVASYDLVARDIDSFDGVTFHTLIVDEAQAVKNATTQRARALRAIHADVCFALSGTPIENHLGELWSIFSIACPGLLGSWEHFRERFAQPIEADNDARARAALARLLRPFLLRRTKEAVTPELPALTEVTRTVDLGPKERAGYEAARRSALEKLTRLTEGPQSRISALAELMRLRRIACHPQLVDRDSAVPSAKLETTLDLVEQIIDGGHRALVFSQFVDHLSIVRRELDARGVKYLYLDGSTKPAERPKLVAEFQSGAAPLFLISLRAGGTGLNLTAADYVLHLDPWWNPAVEDQATDRAHRIGQTRPVTVVRLVAAGTIEEAVVSLHESKRALADSLLEGTDAAARLSMRDLVDLVRGTDNDTVMTRSRLPSRSRDPMRLSE